jgi:hypothetical protein
MCADECLFLWKSGHAANITSKTGFDPELTYAASKMTAVRLSLASVPLSSFALGIKAGNCRQTALCKVGKRNHPPQAHLMIVWQGAHQGLT